MDVAEFLLARIAEDKEAINERTRFPGPGPNYVLVEQSIEVGINNTPWVIEITSARVLAECEAKRRIVEDHGWTYSDPYESWKGPEYRAKWGDTRDDRLCVRCGGVTHHPNLGEVERRDKWPCTTLRALAHVYRDHSDYQQEWAL